MAPNLELVERLIREGADPDAENAQVELGLGVGIKKPRKWRSRVEDTSLADLRATTGIEYAVPPGETNRADSRHSTAFPESRSETNRADRESFKGSLEKFPSSDQNFVGMEPDAISAEPGNV